MARAHEAGLAVIFDVVFNHISDDDSSFWSWDVFGQNDHGEYLYPPAFRTQYDWGWSPAFGKDAVRDFFVENVRMLFDEYRIDGLRFDVTREIERNRGSNNDGWRFLQHLTWETKKDYGEQYLVAEHLPDHETIVHGAGMNGTWVSEAHHQFQRAAQGDDSLNRLKSFLGKNLGEGRNYPSQWNLVKYLLGSHDDCGDNDGGGSINQAKDWKQHRYFVEFYGGRDNWHARAKARLGWALNIAAMGTPMLFTGLECHHWGYWDESGDYRFNWAIAGDEIAMPMRRLVAAANWARWDNPCLRSETLDIVHEDYANTVIAFKRYVPGGDSCVLTVVNMGDANFGGYSYGVRTGGQAGQWMQILCTQDATYGGWDGAGNAYHEPWTQADGMVYINLPKWSVVMLRLR